MTRPGKPGQKCTPRRRGLRVNAKCQPVGWKERKVYFREYRIVDRTREPARMRAHSKPAGKDSKEQHKSTAHLPIKEGKWIYVFRTTSKKGQILQHAEIFANKNGQYQEVDIKNSKVRRADVRIPDPNEKPQSYVKLIYEENETRVENFFCLSRIQLPSKRVEEIRSKLEQFWGNPKRDLDRLRTRLNWRSIIAGTRGTARARVELIPIYSSKTHPSGFFGWDGKTTINSIVNDKENTATVFLTDYFTEALRLHEQYTDLRDKYLEWKGKKRNQDYSYLINMVYELCYPRTGKKERGKRKRKENKSLTDAIKVKEFLKERSKHLVNERKKVRAYRYKVSRLCEWVLESSEFEAVQLDYESGGKDFKKKGEELYQKVIERLHESRRGQYYIFQTYSQQDSWMRKFLFSANQKPHEAFWHILTDIAFAILNGEVAKIKKPNKKNMARARAAALEEFKKIAKQRRSDLRWTQQKVLIGVKRELTLGERKQRRQQVMILSVQKTHATAEALAARRITAELPDGLQNAVSAFNLVLKFNALFASKTPWEAAKNAIGLGASIVNQIVSSSAFSKRLLKRFAKRLTEKAIKTLQRVVGFITGLIDAATGIWDIVDQVKQGNPVAASGAALAVVGAIVSVVGMFMLKGALAGAAVPPVAIVLAIAGIILEVIGQLILLFCGYDDVTYWLRHCQWGVAKGEADKPRDWCSGCEEKKPYPTIGNVPENIFMSWPDNYDKQICALHNILLDYKIQAKYFSRYELWESGRRKGGKISLLRMTIKPNFASEYSKLILKKVLITDKAGNWFALTTPLGKDVVLKKDFVWLEEEKSGSDKKIKSITVEWFDNEYSSLLKEKQNRKGRNVVGKGMKGMEGKMEKLKSKRRSAFTWCYYEAKLDVYGDGKYVIPRSGKKFKHLMLRRNNVPTRIEQREKLKDLDYFYKKRVYKGG